jgi:hypothetical protein
MASRRNPVEKVSRDATVIGVVSATTRPPCAAA